ncbi:MAG: 6-bladed beta-propeller [Thermodesulfovibrionales bacterium]
MASLLMVLLTAGCASKWAMDTRQADYRMQWPPMPNEARVQQVMTISGFTEKGTSLKSLVFGRDTAALVRPVAVVTGRDGRIAIANADCQCVHLYVPSEERHQRLYAAEKDALVSPIGLAFDDELRLYVSDSVLEKIFVYDSQGAYLYSFGKTADAELKRPTGLAYNGDRKILYVVDTLSHKIYAISKDGKVLFSFGERGKEKGQFNFPTHIFWSPAGYIYVTDAMNFRVQIFDSSGNFTAVFGSHGDGSGDFAMPKGVAADKDGIIYAVDSLFDNVQLFNEQGDFLLTVGSRGGGAGEFWLPSGIFIDEKNKMYICDTFNQRLQVFQIMGNRR